MNGLEGCDGWYDAVGNTPFDLIGIWFTVLVSGNSWDCPDVFCRLGALMGSSSSSLLSVRSTICGAGRLLLTDAWGPEDVDGSLEENGGVLSMLG